MRKPIPRNRGHREQTVAALSKKICLHLLAEQRPGPSLQIIKSPAPALFQKHLRKSHHQKHTLEAPSACTGWIPHGSCEEKRVGYARAGHHLPDTPPWAWLCTPHAVAQRLAQVLNLW